MCCTGAAWKREVVQDHKFDFVDVHEYHTTGFMTRLRYSLVYIFLIKSILVYASDIYTAVAMLAYNHWAGNIITEAETSDSINVPFDITKWIFFGCIIFSFLLLAWEGRKARMIIRSRDISYAYTNVMANDYYCLKSYDHFCFFSQINNSKKKKDEFAFFVFFTFKGWKRLLLADAPRQVINALWLFSFAKALKFTTDFSKYYSDANGKFSFVRAGILCTMIFTVVIWLGSAILLGIAALMYVPLLCYIQGNLKEYCCHKIDKRIAELIKRKTKKRLAREAEIAKREAAGDFRHLQDKKGRFKEGVKPLAQPTLPTIDLNDEELFTSGKSDAGSRSAMSKAGSVRRPGQGGDDMYAYPPMPNHAGYPDDGYAKYELSDGAMGPSDSSYSLNQQPHLGYAAYPYAASAGHDGFIDSYASLAQADDKASIRSRDALMQMPDVSQLSMERAPSYKTEESVPGQHLAAGQTYDFSQAHHPQNGGYYEPTPQHPYEQPPYGAVPNQQTSHDPYNQRNPYYQQEAHMQSAHSSQDYAQYARDTASPAHHQPQQNDHLPAAQPRTRGTYTTRRSDVPTFYQTDDANRASVADSQTGAFDLDAYGRDSLYAQNSQPHRAQYPSRESRLDYLQEEVEDAHYPQHHQQNGGYQQQAQQDWQRR